MHGKKLNAFVLLKKWANRNFSTQRTYFVRAGLDITYPYIT